MTSRPMPYLNPKGGGDRSMALKQRTQEVVYWVALQGLIDKVKTGLFEI